MNRELCIVLYNETILTEELDFPSAIANEFILQSTKKVLEKQLDNGEIFVLFCGQLVNIESIVEIYIQES